MVENYFFAEENGNEPFSLFLYLVMGWVVNQ